MTPTYTQAAEKINATALFFAERGYHVTTSFESNNKTMAVTVYFDQCDERDLIESFMTLYEVANDTIHFKKIVTKDNQRFYTLTLTKYTS